MLVALDVRAGAKMESQSGIQRLRPRIYGRLEAEGASKSVAYIVIHPTSNFMGHYLVEPMQQRKRALLALNTRYVGNDTMLIQERAIQDLGAGVRYLREQGYKKVVLIGNSGGGSMTCFYQAQAEKLTLRDTPDGEPLTVSPEDFPRADAIILLGAHSGRASVLLDRLDASVIEEDDPWSADPDLDMFNPAREAPFDKDWVTRYRAAQAARMDRITDWVLARLRALKEGSDPNRKTDDQPFLIHRTNADLRFLDQSLDPSDRKPQSTLGNAATANMFSNGLARFCTLRSFLSQWSVRHTRAEGPANLALTSVPVLNLHLTGDQGIFPSTAKTYMDAAGKRGSEIELKGLPHYPQSVAGAADRIADLIVEWGG